MMTKPLFVTLLALITLAGCSKDPMNMTWEEFNKLPADQKEIARNEIGMDKFTMIIRANFQHVRDADTLKMNSMTLKELLDEGSKLPVTN
jgi:hypothetical protein